MKISVVHSETEARKVSQRKLLAAGLYLGRIIQAVEKLSQAGNETIELVVAVDSAEGSGREFFIRDWLLGNDRGALKLRHAAEAVGALAKYEAGDICDADFVGQNVRVKIIIERRRGYADSNKIEDYRNVG